MHASLEMPKAWLMEKEKFLRGRGFLPGDVDEAFRSAQLGSCQEKVAETAADIKASLRRACCGWVTKRTQLQKYRHACMCVRACACVCACVCVCVCVCVCSHCCCCFKLAFMAAFCYTFDFSYSLVATHGK